jgi:5-methylthioadenosine/S-adenosylhomocysteine deaminase
MSGTHYQPLHSLTTSLVYNTRPGDVQTVIVNGQLIMRNRQLLTLDKAEIIAQVGQSMQRLTQRVPEKRIQVYNP